MTTPRSRVRIPFAAWPLLVPIALFAAMAALYLSGALGLYFAALRGWGIIPYPWPFVDTDTVMSALRCLRKGVDVYAANPCDPERRPFDYSPLWMALSVFPVTKAWIAPTGLAIDLGFLAALFLLPRVRDRRAAVLMTLGTVSSGVVFALERGNNDLILFVLGAGAAALLLAGWGRRRLGYALLFLAGLLKFYPMLTMALALRERPGRFAALTLLSCAGLGAFLAITWPDLSRVLAIIPTGTPFGDMFGSIVVALGLTKLVGLPDGAVPLVRLAMIAFSLTGALVMGLQGETHRALAALTARERSFLLVGALLTIACFFTAQNIGYRVIHLLLALPALLALRAFAPSLRFRWMPGAVLLSLWGEAWRNHGPTLGRYVFGSEGVASLSLWLAKEGVWWFLVTVLAAYLVAFARHSAMGAWLAARLGVPAPAPSFAAD
ncbi:hypothetical protein MTR62_15115 [Novosphingobium sp. 1949]|uniref:DUF2029 domain-containing protein n=1 Tax=Novosphingobium organovorum TaxID=2930092 RepID=A0ABT0BG40_9SPHN|nr:hypothetical protein [Novosphingobium organovorum]MCJ2184014.1 hypothetical protein [Novosphingobium organovorum]